MFSLNLKLYNRELYRNTRNFFLLYTHIISFKINHTILHINTTLTEKYFQLKYIYLKLLYVEKLVNNNRFNRLKIKKYETIFLFKKNIFILPVFVYYSFKKYFI